MSDRVTLRADDAIRAFQCLRSSIEQIDGILAEYKTGECVFLEHCRAEKWAAYQRIAKALRLKPTLSTACAVPK